MTARKLRRCSHGAAWGLSLLLGLPSQAMAEPEPDLIDAFSAPDPERAPGEGAEVHDAEGSGVILPEAPPIELAPLPDPPLAGARGLEPDALVRAEEEAYRLYMTGKRQLEEGEPDAAEQTFGQALRILPDDRPYGRSRGSLALWWVRCHVALFERTGELAVLDRETQILDAYARRLDELAASAEDRAHKQTLLQQRLDEIEATQRLRAAAHEALQSQLDREHEGYRASTWAPDTLQDLGWYPRPDDPRQRAVQSEEVEVVETTLERDRARRPGVGLVVTGALSMAAGVAGLGVMSVGMVRASRANHFDPAQTPMERRVQVVEGLDANTMSTTGAIAGGAMLGLGIILTAIGAARMKKQRGFERAARIKVAPWGLEGRF